MSDERRGASSPYLSVAGLTRTFPSGDDTITVLDGLDLEVERGELVAVVGPSGSGKSTLLALVAGLDRPDDGAIRLGEHRIDRLDERSLALLRRREIGFVFQTFQLLQHLTARENVAVPLDLVGASDPVDTAEELLARVGLSARGHHYPAQLSGGEQQRVAIARAFAARPSLLLADEPTGNLDSQTGRRVMEIFSELRREDGTTALLATHDAEVAALADRRLRLRKGALRPVDEPVEPVGRTGLGR